MCVSQKGGKQQVTKKGRERKAEQRLSYLSVPGSVKDSAVKAGAQTSRQLIIQREKQCGYLMYVNSFPALSELRNS